MEQKTPNCPRCKDTGRVLVPKGQGWEFEVCKCGSLK